VEAAGLEFVDLGPLSAEDEAQKQQIHAQGARSKGKARVKLGCQLFTLMERAMFPPLVEALGSGGAAAGTDAIVADFATLVGGGWAAAARTCVRACACLCMLVHACACGHACCGLRGVPDCAADFEACLGQQRAQRAVGRQTSPLPPHSAQNCDSWLGGC
jgi:hypothetical protein